MTNILGHVLGDQDDVDIVTFQERFEHLFDLRRDRITIDHKKVLRRILATIQFADAAQQKADAGVLDAKGREDGFSAVMTGNVRPVRQSYLIADHCQ